MISLYSGTPGSGKSLHCARTIINWSRLGYPVIGNFAADLSRYKRAEYIYCPNDQLTPQFLIEYSRKRFGPQPKEGSLLLVIDECQLLFNAREWQLSSHKKWMQFFTLHRKFGYDIILIAQFDRMVDRQIRSLIEYEYIHRKMSNFGWQGKVLSIFFGGNTFIAVKRWYPLHERLGSELFHARKRLYSIYDTYAIFDDGQTSAKAKPAQEEKTAPELDPVPDPEVKEGEIVDLPKKPWQQLRDRLPRIRKKEKKQRHRPRCIPGTYQTPWSGKTLYSIQGKYLRPGGRSETGWMKNQLSS